MTINFLNIIQVLVGIALIGFILIQRGPGATAGSAFGGGASGTVFGAKGSGSFLTKSTAILATAFFIVTMLIAIDSRNIYADGQGVITEQDLGVIGSIENETEAVVVPGDEVNSSAAVDAVVKESFEKLTEVNDDKTETVENIADEPVTENQVIDDDQSVIEGDSDQ